MLGNNISHHIPKAPDMTYSYKQIVSKGSKSPLKFNENSKYEAK